MEHASRLSPEVLLRHEEFVLRLARTLVRGEADAEEVAQRTLVSALEHPPRHGALRAWLVRVTKNHAIELHRTERRRVAREQRVARPEAVAAEGSATERLELEHGVVRAVLSLDEPYKSIVVAVYYEGLAPAEIAARDGVPAGTVRSQLTRAHEMLRAKLDRTHGERATWMSGLTGLLALRDVPSGAAGAASGTSSAAAGGGATATGTSSFFGPVAIGVGIAACIAAVLVVRAVVAPSSAIETAAVEPMAVPAPLVESALGASVPAPARSPVDAAAIAPAVAVGGFVPADEPVKLLEQSRQIKKLILDRRLAVTPEERARAGIPVDTATSGVVRLLERSAFGFAFSLPWMREGGSYYSFTERVHDYNRRPQISFQQSTMQGSSSSIVIDLGKRRLADVPASLVAPAWLDPARAFLWSVAHAEVDPDKGGLRELYPEMRNSAFERGEVDEKGLATIEALPREGAEARVGHAYLLRCVSKDEHDVLVALEVIAVSPEQCTIAWRVLESRPVASADRVRVPSLQPGDLPAPSPELARMSEPELLAALASVRARADEVIYRRFAPEIEARFGSWRERTDAGLVRLTPYMSDWAELSTGMIGGAHYSFLARSHDAGSGDVSYQGQKGYGQLGAGLQGTDVGVFVDLGTTPIEMVSLGTVEAEGELGTYVVQHVFPHPKDLPAVEPARQQAIRSAESEERADAARFQARVRELGSSDRGRAIVGRTFAIRAVHFGSSDVLAAVHVAAEDELGVVIAWKLLKSWPVLPRR